MPKKQHDVVDGLDWLIFCQVPSAGQNFSLSYTLVYHQIPAELAILPAALSVPLANVSILTH